MFKKSTSFMRPRVTVLEPHSMSAWPLEIAEKRVCTVTGTHSILMSDTPNCCAIDSVTSWHSSREKPAGSPFSFLNENGVASVRYAIRTVLLSIIDFRRLSAGIGVCAKALASEAKNATESIVKRSISCSQFRFEKRFRDPDGPGSTRRLCAAHAVQLL